MGLHHPLPLWWQQANISSTQLYLTTLLLIPYFLAPYTLLPCSLYLTTLLLIPYYLAPYTLLPRSLYLTTLLLIPYYLAPFFPFLLQPAKAGLGGDSKLQCRGYGKLGTDHF